MTKTIGGFLELEKSRGKEYFANGLKFNLCRNALLFEVMHKGYVKVYLPFYICGCLGNKLKELQISISYYHVDRHFMPIFDFEACENEVVIIVNYFGIFDLNDILGFQKIHKNIIVDNTQAFYEDFAGCVQVYSCRKWFGVSDGAYLTGTNIDKEYERLEQDSSVERLYLVMKKYECPDNDFYDVYSEQEGRFSEEPIKKMSLLTENMLKNIDYDRAAEKRKENWQTVDDILRDYSEGPVIVSKTIPFMYVLFSTKAFSVKNVLKENRIFIPTLWPECLKFDVDSVEYNFAKNMLLLPIDQRYGELKMVEMAKRVLAALKEG